MKKPGIAPGFFFALHTQRAPALAEIANFSWW
jgi:hypothetical protein